MSICLIDTSVFCNIVDVAGRNQQRGQTLQGLKEHIQTKTTLLLPLAAIVETGNHIAQVSDGGLRRRAAERFVSQVSDALAGKAPWTPTPLFEMKDLAQWLPDFPNAAMQAIGLGDLSIIKEWERQCAMHGNRRIFIWSYDQHLAAYDRAGG